MIDYCIASVLSEFSSSPLEGSPTSIHSSETDTRSKVRKSNLWHLVMHKKHARIIVLNQVVEPMGIQRVKD